MVTHDWRYGENGRFAIRRFISRFGDAVFVVHDADWVTDLDLHNGHSSPTVAMFDALEQAQEWCDLVEAGKITSVPHEANFEGWPELERRVKNGR